MYKHFKRLPSSIALSKCAVVLGIITLLLGSSPLAAETISGSGATFPAILLNRMVERYSKETGHTVNYSAVGSFAGLSNLDSGKSDFAVSDVQIEDEGSLSSELYVDIPVTLGAVALVYNLPGVPVLKLTPALLLDILSGRITQWDDDRLKAINSTVKFPSIPIQIVGRADRSGTTFLFNRYLSEVSDGAWAVESNWVLPVASSTKVTGNQAVVGRVASVVGSLGYAEAHYASNSRMVGIVALQNPAQHYILPSVESVLAAVDDVSLHQIREAGINSYADYAYSIVGFSWIAMSKNASMRMSYDKARVLADMIWWMTHQGQIYAESAGFAPLPPNVAKFAGQCLKQVQFDGVILR